MKKMVSMILSSVLMLDLCGAAYEIKPAAMNELTVSYYSGSIVKTKKQADFNEPDILR